MGDIRAIFSIFLQFLCLTHSTRITDTDQSPLSISHRYNQPSNVPKSHPFLCTKEGFFINPTDRSRFYRCLCVDNLKKKFEVYELRCPQGLIFDERLTACSFPHLPPPDKKSCKEKPDNQVNENLKKVMKTPVKEPSKDLENIKDQEGSKDHEKVKENIYKEDERDKAVILLEKVENETYNTQIFTEYSEKELDIDVLSSELHCWTEGFFRNPRNCKKFYRCVPSNGHGFLIYEFHCPHGLVFDENITSCNWPLLSPPCTNSGSEKPLGHPTTEEKEKIPVNKESLSEQPQSETQSFLCSSEGFFEHADECKKFYRCLRNEEIKYGFKMFEFSCPDGLVFDDHQKICNWPEESPCCNDPKKYSDCRIQSENTIITQDEATQGSNNLFPPDEVNQIGKNKGDCKKEGFYRDKKDCQKYYRCIQNDKSEANFLAFYFSCPEGLVFDESIRMCNWAEYAACCGENDGNCQNVIKDTVNATSSEQPSHQVVQTPMDNDKKNLDETYVCKKVGIFPHAKSCKYFYRCIISNQSENNFSAIRESCSPGLVFDKDLKKCNWPEYVPECRHGEIKNKTCENLNQVNQSESKEQKKGLTGRPLPTVSSQKTTKVPILKNNSQDTSESSSVQTADSPRNETITGIENSNLTCKEEGFFIHPESCRKFYRCIFTKRILKAYEYSCPDGLAFDETLKICNWLLSVESCSEDELNELENKEKNIGINKTFAIEAPEIQDSESNQIAEESNQIGIENPHLFCASTGFFEHPETCKKFYRCIFFDSHNSTLKAFEYNCPKDLVFDKNLSLCNWPENVESCQIDNYEDMVSNSSTQKPEKTPPPRDKEISKEVIVIEGVENPNLYCHDEGIFMHPNKCHKFYKCLQVNNGSNKSFKAYEYSCPYNMVFDVRLAVCSWPEDAPPCEDIEPGDSLNTLSRDRENSRRLKRNAYRRRHSSSSNVPCPHLGYFTHPHSCGKFYRCSGGVNSKRFYKVFEYTCPDELVFDEKLSICVWPDSSNPCISRNRQVNKNPLSIYDIQRLQTSASSKEKFDLDINHSEEKNKLSYKENRDQENGIICKESGYFRDLENCNKYYRCVDFTGKGTSFVRYEFSCPNRLVFDEKTGVCTWPSLSPPCKSRSAVSTNRRPSLSSPKIPTRSPLKTVSISRGGTKAVVGSGSQSQQATRLSPKIKYESKEQNICTKSGFFRNSTDCNKFYRCVDFTGNNAVFVIYDFKCPKGLVFDEHSSVCNWPSSSSDNCNKESRVTSPPSAKSTVQFNASTENKYNKKDSPIRITSNGGSSTSSNKNSNEGPKEIHCTKAGFYRNPNDCNKFYRCVDFSGRGISFVRYDFKCPEGLVFDESVSVCTWNTLTPSCLSTETGGRGSSPSGSTTQINQGSSIISTTTKDKLETTNNYLTTTTEDHKTNGLPLSTIQTTTDSDSSGDGSKQGTEDILCTRAGIFRNPNNCSRFYKCVDFIGDGRNFVRYDFECPSGLVFDQSTSVCTWPTLSPPCRSGGGGQRGTSLSRTTVTEPVREVTDSSSTTALTTKESRYTTPPTEVITTETVSRSTDELVRTTTPTTATTNFADTSTMSTFTSAISTNFPSNTSLTGSTNITYPTEESTISEEIAMTTRNIQITTDAGSRGGEETVEIVCTRAGFFRNPNNCSRFYRCVDFTGDGRSFVRYDFECPSGLVFDESTSVCTWPTLSPPCRSGEGGQRGTSPPRTTATEPVREITDILSTTEESRYTNSSTESTTTETWPSSTDEIIRITTPVISRTDTSGTATTNTLTSLVTTESSSSSPSTGNTDFPNVTYSTKEITVSEATFMTTKNTQLTTDSGSRGGEGTVEIVCTRAGFFRNPNNCSRFYRCVDFTGDGRSFVRYDFECPTGLVFDESTSVCTWPTLSPPCRSGEGGQRGTSPSRTTVTEPVREVTGVSSSTITVTEESEYTNPSSETITTDSASGSTDGFVRITTSAISITDSTESISTLSSLMTTDITTSNTITSFGTSDSSSDFSRTERTEFSNVTYSTEESTVSETTSMTTRNIQITTDSEPRGGEGTTEIVCTREGFFRNPNNCSRFYRCVDFTGDGRSFVRYDFECPSGLVFDESISSCNWPTLSPSCRSGGGGQRGTSPSRTTIKESVSEVTDSSSTTDLTTEDSRYTNPSTEAISSSTDELVRITTPVTFTTGNTDTSTTSTLTSRITTDFSSKTSPTETTQYSNVTYSTEENTISEETSMTTRNIEITTDSGSRGGEGTVEIVCTRAGFFRNPNNCSRFYRCVDFTGDGRSFVRYDFECPTGLVFDESTSVCTWPTLSPPCRSGGGGQRGTSPPRTTVTEPVREITDSSSNTSLTTEESIYTNPSTAVITTETASRSTDELVRITTPAISTADITDISTISTFTSGITTGFPSNTSPTGSINITYSTEESTASEEITTRNIQITTDAGSRVGEGTVEIICTRAGFFRNPNNCSRFYRCVDFTGDGRSFVRYDFECPTGLVFDESTSVCTWPTLSPPCRSGGGGQRGTSPPRTTVTEPVREITEVSSTTPPITDESRFTNPSTETITTDTATGSSDGLVRITTPVISTTDISDASSTSIFTSITATDSSSNPAPTENTENSSITGSTEESSISERTSMTTRNIQITTESGSRGGEGTEEIVCTRAGFFRNPNNCSKFYRCVDFTGDGQSFVRYDFECPSGLVFDESISACNWPTLSPSCRSGGGGQRGTSPLVTSVTETDPIREITLTSTIPSSSKQPEYTDQSTGNTNTDIVSRSTSEITSSTTSESRTENNNLTTIISTSIPTSESSVIATTAEQTRFSNITFTIGTSTTNTETSLATSEESSTMKSTTDSSSRGEEIKEGTINIICTRAGFFRNPSNCSRFYRCVDFTGDGNTFVRYDFECPNGLVFDESTISCTWPTLSPACRTGGGGQRGTSPLATSMATTEPVREVTESSKSTDNSRTNRPGYTDESTSIVSTNEITRVTNEISETPVVEFTTERYENLTTIVSTSITTTDSFTNPSQFPNITDSTEDILTTTKMQTTESDSKGDGGREGTRDIICTRAGFFRNPNNCSKFYRCVDFTGGGSTFVRYDYDCPTGLVFDESTIGCTWPTLSPPCRIGGGSERGTSPLVTSETETEPTSGTTKSSTASTLIEENIGSSTVKITTAESRISSARTVTSSVSTPSSIGTTSYPKEGLPGESPLCQKVGYFRHPMDCSKFFICVDFTGNGEFFVRYDFNCSKGLVFDEETKACTWPTVYPPCKSDHDRSRTTAGGKFNGSSTSRTEITSTDRVSTSRPVTEISSSSISPLPESPKPAIRPNVQSVRNHTVCTQTGYFRNPHDCRNFFRCVDFEGSNQTFVRFDFSCPDGLVFDEGAQACNWPSLSAPCNNEPFQNLNLELPHPKL